MLIDQKRALLPLLACLLAAPVAANADQRQVVAVFDIQFKFLKLKKDHRDMLTEIMATELALEGVYQIMPPGDVKKMLLVQTKESYKECYDEKCQIQLGRQLPANKLVTSTVMKIGARCRVTGSLYDLKRQTTDITAREVTGCKIEQLVQSITTVAAKLRAWEGRAEKEEARRKAEAEERERLARIEAGKKAAEDRARRERLAKEKDVKQPGTNLYWLRCPIGQSWTGSSCKGYARGISWHDARNACPGGYRLPTRQEFVSLLGGCNTRVRGGGAGFCNKCAESSRCSSMFGQDEGWYWSSSSSAARASRAWDVYFNDGYVSSSDKARGNNVRCVRSGP